MRKTFAGIAALAVAAGFLGFSGAARATPVTLDVGNSLTSGNITWSVELCSATAGPCSAFSMDAFGGGIKITGPAGDDVTVDIMATPASGTITSAGLIIDGTSGGNATIYDEADFSQVGSPLDSASGVLATAKFDPQANVHFQEDIPGNQTAFFNLVNVPEPATLAVFGLALTALAGVRRRTPA